MGGTLGRTDGSAAMPERSILGWLLIGLIAGVVAKLLTPGRDPGGVIVTILIGIAGSLLAGFVARAAGFEIDGGWHDYVAATLGAIALLLLYRVTMSRRMR